MINKREYNLNSLSASHSPQSPQSPSHNYTQVSHIYLPDPNLVVDRTTTPLPTTELDDFNHHHHHHNNIGIDHDPNQSFGALANHNNKSEIPLAPGTDIIGTILGNFGIWQMRTALIIFLCKIPASWFMAIIIFSAPELEAPDEFQCNAPSLNDTQHVTPNQCWIEDYGDANLTTVIGRQRCPRFTYNYDFMSVIETFDLVCNRSIFVAWTQYWHLFGVLTGGVVATKLMLRLSPRTVYIIGMIVQIMFGVVTGYARDFSLHCAFRCLSAVCCAFMFTSGHAIFTDITGGKYRLSLVLLYDTFWGVGVVLLPGLASFFNHWTFLYLGITFPTILLVLLLKWTPDSPRWLLKNGHELDIHKVECIVREAAEINDRTFCIPIDFRQQLEELRETLRSQPPPAGWFELWRGPRAKLHMIAAHLALAAYVTNFMGTLLNIRSFGREYRVPNTIVMGFADMVGCFVALHFLLKNDKWKFQYTGMFNVIAGLIACLGWTFTDVDMNPDLKVTLWMLIAVASKASITCGQSMLVACLAELMPANKKAPFVFSCLTWARVWLLSAPFINVLKNIDVAMSLSAFGIITLGGGLFTLLLLPPHNTKTQSFPSQDPTETNRKENSPLTSPIWTIDDNVNNTRL